MMENCLPLHVTELLCSRICHDLVSPVGAINNGIELLDDFGIEEGGAAIGLIAHSAGQAANKLTCFRLAYGKAGCEQHITPQMIHEAVTGWFEGGRYQLEWSNLDGCNPDLPGFLKVLLNVIMLAAEALGQGGVIYVFPVEDGKVEVQACGAGAGLKSLTRKALERDVGAEELDARTVHAFVTSHFARRLKIGLCLRQDEEKKLTFILNLP